MAMKDVKSVQIEPDQEESTVRLFQSFGWEMKSTQEVKTQDVQLFTGQDSDGTKHYQTKRGEHYIKLTFERDPEIKNYAELKSLEQQYYNVQNPADTREYPQRFGCLWIILSIIGLFLFVAPGIAIIVWRFVRYSKLMKIYQEETVAYNKELDVVNNKRQEIIEKAQALV